jgi:CDP-diacylglycerol--glycerol-3-phosphate 3-phosphatidyltransferase
LKWTIPNLLSILRVLAAPCVAIAFAVLDRPDADRIAVAIFIGAALTDYLDGILARGLGQESAFGKMLDPIADKAMVLIALGILIHLYDMQWQIVIPAAMIMLREVLISGLREFLGDVKLAVTNMAKWKTTLQMFAICFLLLRGAIVVPEGGRPLPRFLATAIEDVSLALGAIGLMLIWVAAWFTLVTGGDYLMKAMPYIREKDRASRPPAPGGKP